MKRYTIKTNGIGTIDWFQGKIVDWKCAGQLYSLDGECKQIAYYHLGYTFDASITSSDGKYAFLYQRLGTKGLLLKEGKILREINRSYYHADTYEYPAAFFTFSNKTYLTHCPKEYCRLDFEDVETGEIVTDIQKRNPSDVFHSRLSISLDGKYLMSCGWLWHPLEIVQLFNIKECFEAPISLDNSKLAAEFGTEINSADFIDDDSILLGSSNEESFDDNDQFPASHMTIWNFKKNEISTPVKNCGEFGNLFVINKKYAWDMYKFPKLINITTGEIEAECKEVDSGIQNSSIYHTVKQRPQIRFDKSTGKIAVMNGMAIEVFSP